MKKMEWLRGGVLLAILAFCGCKKGADGLDSRSRTYVSDHDMTVDFNSYKTFGISDSVDVIRDNRSYGRECTVFDSAVISSIIQSMHLRGYQVMDKRMSPELAVHI